MSQKKVYNPLITRLRTGHICFGDHFLRMGWEFLRRSPARPGSYLEWVSFISWIQAWLLWVSYYALSRPQTGVDSHRGSGFWPRAWGRGGAGWTFGAWWPRVVGTRWGGDSGAAPGFCSLQSPSRMDGVELPGAVLGMWVAACCKDGYFWRVNVCSSLNWSLDLRTELVAGLPVGVSATRVL